MPDLQSGEKTSCAVDSSRLDGKPLEAALWDFSSGCNPRRLRNEVHGYLIRLFYLNRQVMTDLGITPLISDFAKAVLRRETELGRLLLGTHDQRSKRTRMHSTELAMQWTMLLHWWWKERKGPALYLVIDGRGQFMPHAQWPNGRVMEDPIIRERREHKDPRYPEWGYQDTMRYYDDQITKARAEDEAATKPKRKRGRGRKRRRGKNPFPT